jgi:chemotaxis protein MotB
MQMNGIRGDQITKVRGFADQRLRKPDAPLDPVNRRISLIVQYIEKPTAGPAASTQEGGSQSTGEKKEAGAGEGQKKALAEEGAVKP